MKFKSNILLRLVMTAGLSLFSSAALACFNEFGQPVSCSSSSCDAGLSTAGGQSCIVVTNTPPTPVPDPVLDPVIDITDEGPGPAPDPNALPDVFQPEENSNLPDLLSTGNTAEENFVLKHESIPELLKSLPPLPGEVENFDPGLPIWMEDLMKWSAPFQPGRLPEFEERFQREWRLHELETKEREWWKYSIELSDKVRKRREEALDKFRKTLPENMRQMTEQELTEFYDPDPPYSFDIGASRTPILDSKLFAVDPFYERLVEIQDVQDDKGALTDWEKREKKSLENSLGYDRSLFSLSMTNLLYGASTETESDLDEERQYRRYRAIRWSEETTAEQKHHSVRNEVQGIIALD